MSQVTRGTALLMLMAALVVFSACSNVETPDLDADIKEEQIIPVAWQPLPLRVGIAPFRAALELDEKRYNIDDTQRWVLTPDAARLNGAGGLHSQLLETFRKYRMFERVEMIDGATPDTSREDLQAAALRQGLDIVLVPTLKRQDVGYVDSNGAYGWNMFVRSLDDWDEGWNLFSIFSTPGHFDEENWTRIGNLLMPIAENEAKKSALKYVTGDLAEESQTDEFLEGIRRRVALVVGVDGSGQPPLPLSRFATQDAEAFASQLLDAQDAAVPEGAIRTIVGARATRRAVLSAAEELSALARYNDDVYLVFNGVGGLDAKLNPTLVLTQPAGTKQLEQVQIGEVLDALLKNNPRTLTLVLDCSFVAPGDKRCATTDAHLATLTEKGKTGILLAPIIKAVEARGTRCIVLSATDATLHETPMPALEIEDLNHGLFSSFALQGLSGDADSNRDRMVTYNEFQKYVGEKVSYIAGLEGRTQTGWFYASPESKDFALPAWRE